MKTAIAILFASLAATAATNAASAEKYRLVFNDGPNFKNALDRGSNQIETETRQVYTTSADSNATNERDTGREDPIASILEIQVLAATNTTFSTLTGASIGLAQDQTANVNTGVTFNKDSSNQNNNDNQPSEGSNIGIVVKSYDGITIQPYEPNWTGSIAVKPDNYPNDIPRIKEPTPAPICQGFTVDNVEAVEGEVEYSNQTVTGCAGTLITQLYFIDGSATKGVDYGHTAQVQFKLPDQPWQEFTSGSPFRIPDQGYFIVRTDIVNDVEGDDGEDFKLAVHSEGEVATGMVTLLDPVEAPIAASAEASLDWSDMGEIIASLDLDDLSPKQALEVLYALQAIENDNRN
jgi:hypothetical protein